MPIYTINYTDTENLAMSYAALSVEEWIQNVVHDRARSAIDDIVKIAVPKFFETSQSIPSTKEEIVAAAFSNGWVKTVEQKNAEVLTSLTANTP
jgi:hypothetical protein